MGVLRVRERARVQPMSMPLQTPAVTLLGRRLRDMSIRPVAAPPDGLGGGGDCSEGKGERAEATQMLWEGEVELQVKPEPHEYPAHWTLVQLEAIRQEAGPTEFVTPLDKHCEMQSADVHGPDDGADVDAD